MKDFKTFTKIAKNVGDLSKIILATGFGKLPKCNKSPNLVTLAQHKKLNLFQYYSAQTAFFAKNNIFAKNRNHIFSVFGFSRRKPKLETFTSVLLNCSGSHFVASVYVIMLLENHKICCRKLNCLNRIGKHRQLVVSIPRPSAPSCHLLGKINVIGTFFSTMTDHYRNHKLNIQSCLQVSLQVGIW